MTNPSFPAIVPLTAPLTLNNALRFPVQSRESRREVLVGALWLLVPGYGWVLNMGHRILITHALIRGRPGWPSWRSHRAMLRHGLITLAGMVVYHLPAAFCFASVMVRRQGYGVAGV